MNVDWKDKSIFEDVLDCEADDILIAPGSKMLLYLAMRLFHGGEIQML